MADKKKKIDYKKILKKCKENYWAISTITLAILLTIILINGATCSSAIGATEAGQKVLEFANNQGANAELITTTDNGQLYEVILSIPGQDGTPQEVPVYVTKDGENLIPSLIPLTANAVQDTPQRQTQDVDWNVFENELPSDVKSKILSFNYEEPEIYDEELRINEFANYDLIPKTLISFYGAGCGWCTKYHPVLVEAMEKYPEITIYALDLSANRDIAEKYGATGTPANVINGKYFVSGYRPIEGLSEILDELNK